MEEEKKEVTIKLPKLNLWMLISTALVICLVGVLWFNPLCPSNASSATGLAVLSEDDAGNKAIDYLNNNIVQQGTKASLVSVQEKNGIYEVMTSYRGNDIPIYITKDGSLLFLNRPLNTSEEIKRETQEESQQTLTCGDVPKRDKPLLQTFVVSKCPFGLQMQRILSEIVKNIPSLANNIEVRYIGSIQNGKITSMHGEKEAEENLRQICIREEQHNKYWSYIACHIKNGDVYNCLIKAGIDIDRLNACMNDTSRGLKYARDDFNLYDIYKSRFGQKIGVGENRISMGSPAVIINEDATLRQRESYWSINTEFDFATGEGKGNNPRSAENIKELLCCGFTEAPIICSTNLSSVGAATMFSETYSGSSGSGKC